MFKLEKEDNRNWVQKLFNFNRDWIKSFVPRLRKKYAGKCRQCGRDYGSIVSDSSLFSMPKGNYGVIDGMEMCRYCIEMFALSSISRRSELLRAYRDKENKNYVEEDL
jgi:hypothetical protein